MKVAQKLYSGGRFILENGDRIPQDAKALILAFGNKRLLISDDIYGQLSAEFPNSDIVLCSTAGEIYEDTVLDDTVSVSIMMFEQTGIKTVSINIADHPNSYEAGRALFGDLNSDQLSNMLIISDGSLVNGSELVRGLEQENKRNIPITGGLAGDGDKFISTTVGCNTPPQHGTIAAIGFYGRYLQIGHGSMGGWDIFGPEKQVTRSVSNRLFEIDNKSALELYKQYLGRYADELPGSALLFPLYVRPPHNSDSVVRTILSIDNDEQSMIFAGDIPEGAYIRFMKANFDKIIDAATCAANKSLTKFALQKPKLALLISCVGRKLILGNRIDEETEAVKEIFGDKTILTGFYSYGEISPVHENSRCELHNQTMTITTFIEEIDQDVLS
ncbi:FIST signal transduction protein [Mucilaginibacter celer]|uniref:Histidine kinase n=1 Tax=Mucilaginibacter celer TaxID=2305508 RepID=A0A494VPR8_9SPHI|nr:FIST N-terminal domain-containing protein [Mucilaginibacter celer]AYL95150.1 histidine kinase [Mucilaginibacter celer]